MALPIGRTILGYILDQHLTARNNAALRFVYLRDNLIF
jgi:hypothetical protein